MRSVYRSVVDISRILSREDEQLLVLEAVAVYE
jgi:hypothetical protein